MKKIHYYFIGLFVLFIITVAASNQSESAKLYEKTVFIEIDFKQDSMLFTPYSKAWDDSWVLDADLKVNGSELMNYEKYKFSFKQRKENLWTILHPMIIEGTIQSYYPYDPETYGMGPKDDGELRYPIVDVAKQETFVYSDNIRENLSYMLGRYGVMADSPLSTPFGDDSVAVGADGMVNVVYPPRDFYWHKDKDIVKYKIRVSVFLNKDGIVKKRVIQSICPIVYQLVESSEVKNEEELIWLNFEEITPLLKASYFFDENGKPMSYFNYFMQKVNNADLRGKE